MTDLSIAIKIEKNRVSGLPGTFFMDDVKLIRYIFDFADKAILSDDIDLMIKAYENLKGIK